MTPRGSYRQLLERHLSETQQHERAVARRTARSGATAACSTAAYGAVTPPSGRRSSSPRARSTCPRRPRGEEKLLKNARDEVVTEALEIAIYDVIEALAKAIGDNETARLAARHRADEEKMLGELRRLPPEAVARAARSTSRRRRDKRKARPRGATQPPPATTG